MARKSTKVIDRGYKKIVRELRIADHVSLEVGYFGDDTVTHGLSIPEIAAVNEYGSADGHVPERSFLRTAFDEKLSEYTSEIRILVGRVLDQKITAMQMVATMGIMMVSDVKKKITEIKTPPNAPGTVAKKGFNNPLIDTGTMRNATTHRIKVK